MTLKLGPTGRYPRGKLGPYDEGEVVAGVAHDHEGNVHVNFGKPIMSFAMPVAEARGFAALIIQHANKAENHG